MDHSEASLRVDSPENHPLNEQAVLESRRENLYLQSADEANQTEALLPGGRSGSDWRPTSPYHHQYRNPDYQLRPYWLGLGLFLILFAFWLLDSLKDPIFARLVDGNLDRHQPPAKLCSVLGTLALVCLLEFLSNAREQNSQDQERQRSGGDIMDGGGTWEKMRIGLGGDDPPPAEDAPVPVKVFVWVGLSYSVAFMFITYLLGLHPSFASESTRQVTDKTFWHVVAYAIYAIIESFGSLAVATFWSYTNSTLSLEDAEAYYGLVIAIAQLGAIAGATMVTTHFWSTARLIILAVLIICFQIVVMLSYDRRFPATQQMQQRLIERQSSITTIEASNKASEPPTSVFWSGVHLILKHNYVLLILGVSCLYEVSLTCLDYQMKLLGWNKFEQESTKITFAQFMGRFGQLTNLTSLLFSSLAFPFLIHQLGLRWTLRLFPTLLVVATVVAYGAVPLNLTVLFISISLLKAMTYSIHDPSKELLYLPTSNTIKFKAKFWIDVVGARIAKAIGSSINTYAGSAERSVSIASVPSFITAAGLWYVCFRVGIEFDKLVANGLVVGHDNSDEEPAKVFDMIEEEDYDDQEGTEEGVALTR